jgi:hypothetical protein
MCHGEAFAEYTHYSCGVKTNAKLGYPVTNAKALRKEWKVILSIFFYTLSPIVSVVGGVVRKRFPVDVMDVWYSFIHKFVCKEFMPGMFATKKWLEFKMLVLNPTPDVLYDLVSGFRPARALKWYWKEQGEVQIFVPGGAPVVSEEAQSAELQLPASRPSSELESVEAEDPELEMYFSENLPFFGKSARIGTGTKKKAKSKGNGGSNTPLRPSKRQRDVEEKAAEKEKKARAAQQVSGKNQPEESGSAAKKGKPLPPVAPLSDAPIDVIKNPPAYLSAAPAAGQIFKVQKTELEKALPLLLGLAHNHGYTEVMESDEDQNALFLTRPK